MLKKLYEGPSAQDIAVIKVTFSIMQRKTLVADLE